MKKFVFLCLSSIVFSYSLKAQCNDTPMYDIFTPRGSYVLSYVTCESSAKTRLDNDNKYASTYPNAQQIKTYDGYSSTRKFNCHGYAWIKTEDGIDRWIGYVLNNRDPDVYTTDGSYLEVPSAVYPGKIFWNRPADHSAVTTDQKGIVISKWNEYPLMKHNLNYGPFASNGTNVKYYVKTPVISGADLIPCSGTVSFTLPSGVTSTTWNAAGATIVSGQGTNKLTVQKTSGTTAQSILISVSGTYKLTSVSGTIINVPFDASRIVSVGAHLVTSLTGPSSINKGGSATFTASPQIPATEGGYEWSVLPATGVTQSKWLNSNMITFKNSGSYTVMVRTTSSCTTPNTYKTVSIMVQ